jgi:small subunit ribosomal protein S16
MVRIRLARSGQKKRPFYSIVIADIRKKRDGGFIERVGFFNPVAQGQEEKLRLNQERINYWLSQGAQPTERVAKLIKQGAATEA